MIDRHHLLYDRRSWTLRPHARKLRETPSLMPRLDRDVHEALHTECPPVPLLGHYALAGTMDYFQPVGNTMDDISNLIIAMEKGTRGDGFHWIERELVGLAIEAIELQIPFIREGITR